MKFKTIHSNGYSFIKRLSIYFKNGSLKFHIILSDDKDAHHSHPWNFTSVILFGGYTEEVVLDDNRIQKRDYGFLQVNKKKYHQKHKVALKRIFGKKIPCITVGWYSTKKQLCSFCTGLGYCKESKKA